MKKKRVSGEQQAMLPEEKKISRTPLPPVTTLEPYRVAPGSPYSAIRLGFNRTLDLHFAREKIEHTPTETPVLPTITPTPPVVPPDAYGRTATYGDNIPAYTNRRRRFSTGPNATRDADTDSCKYPNPHWYDHTSSHTRPVHRSHWPAL